jgi:hypothetical protein
MREGQGGCDNSLCDCRRGLQAEERFDGREHGYCSAGACELAGSDRGVMQDHADQVAERSGFLVYRKDF